MQRILCVLVLAACRTYEPKPLRPNDILKTVEQRREEAGDVTSLARATELMRAHNPRVREARAAYATARAVADTPTPLPNPSLEAGPLLLAGGEVGAEGGLGWAVLLGGRRRLTDDLNAVRADAALAAAAGVEREEYLGLRRDYVGLTLAEEMLAAREELMHAVDASREATRRLVDAGTASELDRQELEMEGGRAATTVLAAREDRDAARAALGARAGVSAAAIAPGPLPAPPPKVPLEEALRELFLGHHSGLARRRGEYEVAEKELRLEISKQYPALHLGSSYEREEGENRFGLSFGIELPVFDRNQPAIARAHARREEVRSGFEAEVARGLAAIETARARLVIRRERLALVEETLLPAAEEARRAARQALEAGAIDTLRFLSVLRADRAARLEALAAKRAVYEAWLDLERACGAPLLAFPEGGS